MFTLDKNALDHLEELRQISEKKDVIMELVLNLTYLKHSAKLGKFFEFPMQGAKVIASTYQVNPGDNNLRILVDDDPNGTLLSCHFVSVSKTLQIKASDWENDYQEALGIGRFLIVEVPLHELNQNSVVSLEGDQRIFKERLDEAYKILPTMEEDLRKGEWGDVVKQFRELLELFKKDVTQFIKEMINQTTSLNEKSSNFFTMALDNLYGYTNELHHKVDSKKNVSGVYTGGKEDAYMAYMVATSITNLLANKFSKTISSTKPSASLKK